MTEQPPESPTDSQAQHEQDSSSSLKKRKIPTWVWAVAGVIGLFAVIFGGGDEETAPVASDGDDQNTTTTTPSTPAKKLSTKEQITRLVSESVDEENNRGQTTIREVDVVKQANGGWGVFTEFNASENLTNNLTKSGIEKTTSEIYIALYTSKYDVRSASVAAYFPLVDKYGNEKDGVVYKSILDQSEAKKVNFAADESYLKLDILPRVWTTTLVHPDFR
ncbi:hypothetical protein [Haloechinothrix salitolerans]|uniref:DUF4352 domain-containing protein n=1 Tax=Haloechinothrix salitolerans TaxID=926830 RepID=A0ABW2C748_9PSEU